MEKSSTPKKTRDIKTQIYQFEGLDKKNHKISGEIMASTLPRARTLLQMQGINVLKIKKKSISIFNREKKVKSEEISLFTRQMATMLNAGIPLAQSLAIISEGEPTSALGKLATKIKLDVENGSAFSIALRKNARYFDELYCSLIESGEQSGTLDTMLDRIALYKEKTDSLKRKVKKALYYPTAIIIIAGVVSAILLIKVVPTFKDMFQGYGAELPAFTQFVLNMSDVLQNYGLYIFGAMVILGYVLVHLYQTNIPFQHILQRFSLKLPVFGKILKQTVIASFARTLSTTSAAGVPLTEALESVAKASNNVVYRTAILEIKEGISTGQRMRVAMKKTEIFPNLVIQMIGIGEESGALEDMLGKIASIYEEEVDASVDGLTSLLEPIIMVILGIVVGGLVIAMYLPIFKMGSIL
ncbi:MAG TPA: type II secretion system F family protein [Gammaproteobacteria bacterium]|nr:type II secretion system F family protein [Gammaproteobacteria bacterium]